MPFYEYHCTKCGHHHEELQKISDPPLRKCPECGRNALTRLVSAPVFRLKGGGWYETDFKSDQEGKRNLAVEKDEAPKPAEAADKPAETATKPAETAAAPKPAKAETPSKTAAKAAGRKTAAAAKAPARKPPARPAARGKRR